MDWLLSLRDQPLFYSFVTALLSVSKEVTMCILLFCFIEVGMLNPLFSQKSTIDVNLSVQDKLINPSS